MGKIDEERKMLPDIIATHSPQSWNGGLKKHRFNMISKILFPTWELYAASPDPPSHGCQLPNQSKTGCNRSAHGLAHAAWAWEGLSCMRNSHAAMRLPISTAFQTTAKFWIGSQAPGGREQSMLFGNYSGTPASVNPYQPRFSSWPNVEIK